VACLLAGRWYTGGDCTLSANLELVGRLTLDRAGLLHVCIHDRDCFPAWRGYVCCPVRATQLVALSPVRWVVLAEPEPPANQANTIQQDVTHNAVQSNYRACPGAHIGQARLTIDTPAPSAWKHSLQSDAQN